MRRRVVVAMLLVTAVTVALFGVPLAVVIGRVVNDDATLRVERQAVLAASSVPADFASGQDPVELPSIDGLTIGLYDSGGNLVAGVGPQSGDAVTLRAIGNEVVDVEGAGARTVAVPVYADERVVGAIRAQESTALSDARSRRLIAWLFGLAVTVLAVGSAIGYVVAGRLVRPVRRLRDAAVKLGDGNFGISVPESGVPELDQVARAMTTTARRLDEVVARERMFSADVSHQLRTPLAGLRAAIETELEFPRPDHTAALHEVISDVDRLERTVAELLALARDARMVDEKLVLGPLFEELESRWRHPFSRAGRGFTVAPARFTPPVRGSGVALRHALDVLVDNAFEHGAGEVRLDIAFDAGFLTITISDEGPGFGDAVSEVPDPDRSAATAARGLGLPLARRLIESMPGRLTIRRSTPHPQIDIVLERTDGPRPLDAV